LEEDDYDDSEETVEGETFLPS